MSHLPVLLVIVPLMAALLAHLLGSLLGRRAALAVALAAVALDLWMAVKASRQVWSSGNQLRYQLSGWQPPYGIELVMDGLSAVLTVLVASVALVSLLHSTLLVKTEIGHKAPQFYALALLLVTALMGITLTGDAFNLYVMLEISSLATYGLIASGGGRAYLATFHYIVMGTIGASFYLLGVGYLYIQTGTLNMADLHQQLALIPSSVSVQVGFGLMLIGTLLKMALFPLHAWLPNAYTYAPDPTSSLVAPLSTKVSVYILIRMMLSIFGPQFQDHWSDGIVLLASIGIVAGSLMALARRDLKKAFACIIVAEAGYMAGGVWVGNALGMTGAIFHLISDALVTLGLFMIVGNIVYAIGGRNFDQLGKLFQRLPATSIAFVCCALCVIGVPPTSGFFSKFYLVTGAIQSGHWYFVLALLVASLCNVGIFFRIFEHALYGKPVGDYRQTPTRMVVPVVTVAALLILLGLFSNSVIERLIVPVVSL